MIRDTPAAIPASCRCSAASTTPPRPLRLEILIVRASRTAVSPQVPHSDLPEALTRRLRELLGYDNYEMEAQAQLPRSRASR